MPEGESQSAIVAALPERAPTFSADAVHLLRNAHAVQYQLSQMADQKASMLLGITFVIFTLSLGQARGGAIPPLPVLLLAGAAFLAATLTVLAVLPAVKGPPALVGGRNLLFFGAFSQLSEQEFVDALMTRLADTPSVYELFAHDIYQNGRVLAQKKYRLLGWAYRALLAGLFLSLAAFVAPFLLRLVAR